MHCTLPPLLDQLRPSVCLSMISQTTAKMIRDRPMGLQEVTSGLLRGSHPPTPCDYPFPETGGSQPLVKTCVANLQPNGARYNGGLY